MSDFPVKGPGAEWGETLRLRTSDQAAADARTRPPAAPTGGAPARLVQTTTVTTYPTAAARFYAVTPLDAAGDQTEGSTGSFAAGPGTFYALNLGTAIPPSGTQLLVTWVAHRWVFRYDS
jgi:hypothetical protein